MSDKTPKIFVDDGGSGATPVVFVHSLAGNTNQWSAQLHHVRKTRRAMALDLRGHGNSAPPADGDYSIEALVSDVHTAVEELALSRFVLVGHSMGGVVATAYAAAHGERVDGLMLVDPSGDSTQMPEEQIAQILGALQSDGYAQFIEGYWRYMMAESTEATVNQVLADLSSTPMDTVVGIMMALFSYDPKPALFAYDGPQLSVVTPANDTPIALHRCKPTLPYEIVTAAGHWLQIDKPEEFNQILDRFLGKVSD